MRGIAQSAGGSGEVEKEWDDRVIREDADANARLVGEEGRDHKSPPAIELQLGESMKLRALCAALSAVLLGVSVGASAQATGAARFSKLGQSTQASRLPPGLDTTPTTVVVILPGDSVAAAQETAGRRLSRGEKDQVKGQRRKDQDAIKGQILAAGGTIVGTFQSALNGIKVRIPANKMAALRAIPGVADVKGVNRYERENADRRAARPGAARLVGRTRRARRGHQARDHRHRHRLHARELRRPGNRRRLQRSVRDRTPCRPIRRCSVPARRG